MASTVKVVLAGVFFSLLTPLKTRILRGFKARRLVFFQAEASPQQAELLAARVQSI
ncbi:hypothetical protein [Levilactobacillus enshiensis]|uniref:hypothetical protein n=1 Tax=Levilactobacillus enshiensis TaxID=2590213 RepID=UPI00131C3A30|nr:hypothetical protein [Levilactobacillus enshiensis]